MIWAAALGVFLQLWINFEVGRWTIATGETVYTGYSRIWRGFCTVVHPVYRSSVGLPRDGRAHQDLHSKHSCLPPAAGVLIPFWDNNNVRWRRHYPFRSEDDLQLCRTDS